MADPSNEIGAPPLPPPPFIDNDDDRGIDRSQSPPSFGPGSKSSVEIGRLSSAGDVMAIGQIVGDLIVDHDGTRARLKFSGAVALSDNQELRDKELCVCTPTRLKRLLAELQQRRLLVLIGSPGTGKKMLANCLGAHLRDARRAATQIVRSQAKKVPLNLVELVTGAPFQGRATVFIDAFAGENENLIEFMTNLDRITVEQFAEKLQDNNAHLIFTIDTEHVRPWREKLAQHVLCVDLDPLTDEEVEEGLRRVLAWLERHQTQAAKHIHAAASEGKRIIRELRTMQRITAFLESFLAEELDTIDLALRRHHDIGDWFTNSLASDIDAWCFALTLAVALEARKADEVRWYDFENLRRAITDHIKGNQELFPRRHRVDGAEMTWDEKHTAGESLDDSKLLTKCRAEVVRDPSRLLDFVRFRRASHAEEIWQQVVQQHRRVLTSILPRLREIAEGSDSAEGYSVRVLAAQMIGRIGELDPYAISIPVIQKEWVRPSSRAQRPFVGRVVQGMLASKNENYRRIAYNSLNTLVAQSGNGDTDRLLAAISAYSQLGVSDLSLAMKCLGRIAIDRLAPVAESLRKIDRLLEKVGRQRSQVVRADIADDLLYWGRKISAGNAATFLALAQAVVYVCVMRDAIEPLRAMRDWTSKGGETAGTLVALLFLHGGIPEQIEAFSSGGGTSGEIAPSPILESLQESDDAAEHLSAFLADVYASINAPYSFTSELQRELKECFDGTLMRWARQAVANPSLLPNLQRVIVRLARTRNELAKEDILTLLASEPLSESEGMSAFAAQCRKALILGNTKDEL